MCNFIMLAHSRDGGKATRQSLDTPVPLWYAVGGWETESGASRRSVKSRGVECDTTAPLWIDSRRSEARAGGASTVGEATPGRRANMERTRVRRAGVNAAACRYDAALRRGCKRPMKMVARAHDVGTKKNALSRRVSMGRMRVARAGDVGPKRVAPGSCCCSCDVTRESASKR